MKYIKSVIILLAVLSLFSCSGSFENRVKKAVRYQVETYPKSHLMDIYKSFFQDKFGPGHLLSDTAAAGRYLRYELSSYSLDTCDHIIGNGTGYESMGYDGNFIRVDLALIKNGTMSYDQFFDLFLKSMKDVTTVDVAAWKDEWTRVEKIIAGMDLSLPDYETERDRISAALSEGEYVWHHSSEFNRAYQPHYRIMSAAVLGK